jgi:hypothetical protein
MKSFTKHILLLVLFLFIVIFFLTKLYTNAKKEIKKLESIKIQNEQYYNDIINAKEDSIFVLSGRVKELNFEKNYIEDYYTTQLIYYKIKIDSFSSAGPTTDTSRDSTTITVNFSGKKNIVSYNGFTRYFTHTNSGTHFIDFYFDPIYLRSTLFEDQNGIWKIKTESLTPGIKVKTDYSIDSSFFVDKLSKEEKEPLLKLSPFLYSSISKDKKDSFLDFGVDLKYSYFFVGWEILNKRLRFGMYYDINFLYK